MKEQRTQSLLSFISSHPLIHLSHLKTCTTSSHPRLANRSRGLSQGDVPGDWVWVHGILYAAIPPAVLHAGSAGILDPVHYTTAVKTPADDSGNHTPPRPPHLLVYLSVAALARSHLSCLAPSLMSALCCLASTILCHACSLTSALSHSLTPVLPHSLALRLATLACSHLPCVTARSLSACVVQSAGRKKAIELRVSRAS